MKQRLTYIDALRGFAIILVVMGHLLEHNGYARGDLFNIIYSFHMPLFFCISGFVTMYACKLCKESSVADYGKYIWRKFQAIMIPYFVWALIVSPFFFAHSFDGSSYLCTLKAACIDNTSYWFLPCLFILLVVFTLWQFAVNKCKKNNPFADTLTAILGGVLLIGIQQVTHIDFFRSAVSYFLPFFIGVFMGKYEKLKSLVVDSTIVYAVCLVLFCLIIGLFGNGMPGAVNKVIRLVCGIMALPVFFHFFAHTHIPEKVSQGLELFGKYTLIIYVMHFPFTRGLLLPADMGLFAQIVVFTCIAIALCGFCVLAAKFIEKSKLLSRLMLGKISKQKIILYVQD